MLQASIDQTASTPRLDPAVHQALPDNVRRDPWAPELRRRLASLHRSTDELTAAIETATGQDPLPTEHPAAALWWRLADHGTTQPLPAPAAPERPGAHSIILQQAALRAAAFDRDHTTRTRPNPPQFNPATSRPTGPSI